MQFSFDTPVYDEVARRVLLYLDTQPDVKPVIAPLLRLRIQKAKLDWEALPTAGQEGEFIKIDLNQNEVRLVLQALSPDVPPTPDEIYDRAITWAKGGEAELWDDKGKLQLLLAGVKFADMLDGNNKKRLEFKEATSKLELGIIWDKL